MKNKERDHRINVSIIDAMDRVNKEMIKIIDKNNEKNNIELSNM